MQQYDRVALSHLHVRHLAAKHSPPPFLVRKCRGDHVRHVRFSCSSRLRMSSSMAIAWRQTFSASALALDAIRFEEILHGRGNFDDMCFQREMAGIEELNLGARYIFPKRFRSSGNEERIVFAPDRKQRGFRFTEIFLEFRIQPQVRRVIQKQIQLNLFIPRTFEERRVQRVRLGRNTLRMGYTVGVLPARSSGCQNALTEYVPILCCGCSPVFSDRAPGLAEAFFVCVPILSNECCDPLRVSHRQAEASWRAIVEHIDCVAIDFKYSRKGPERQSQLIERVGILSVGRDLGKSEPREVWCNHAVFAGQARNKFAEHERRSGESMQQEYHWSVCCAGITVKHLYAVGLDLMDGRQRHAESGIALARRSALCCWSCRIIHGALSPFP